MSGTVPPVLEIADLTVRRERGLLLDRVSLALPPGSITALVGPNGAGKSTLIAALLGQIEFTGRIRFHWRGTGRIGLVPQRFGVDPTLPLTAGEFLALSRQRRPVCFGITAAARVRVEALLADVGLAGFASQPLGLLSGGEIQRLLFANAMDPAPELLVLDEPASGLDETAARRLEERVLAVRDQTGTTVLMVSHDLGQVRRLADLVVVLNRSVTASGRPEVVLPRGAEPDDALDAGVAAP